MRSNGSVDIRSVGVSSASEILKYIGLAGGADISKPLFSADASANVSLIFPFARNSYRVYGKFIFPSFLVLRPERVGQISFGIERKPAGDFCWLPGFSSSWLLNHLRLRRHLKIACLGGELILETSF
jgi:hypothetical protein